MKTTVPKRLLVLLAALGLALPAPGQAAITLAAGASPDRAAHGPALARLAAAHVVSGQQSGQQATYARAAEIEALEVQASQLDELVKERLGRGETISDEVGETLTDIFGQIARFREIQRRHANLGGEGTGVAAAEVAEVADRIAALRLQLRPAAGGQPAAGAPTGDPTAAGGAVGPAGGDPAGAGRPAAGEAPATAPVPVSIPQGTRVIIRLKTWLSSGDAEVGDRFEATAVDDVRVDGRVAVPEGALFEGYVTEVEPARRGSRGGKLTLIIDRVYADGDRPTAIRATVVGAAYGEELEGEDVDTGKTVTRGIIGAIIGGLIGGGKGALIGLGIGSGGTLLAERGEEVDLPAGTDLRVRFESSVSVTWGPAGGR